MIQKAQIQKKDSNQIWNWINTSSPKPHTKPLEWKAPREATKNPPL